MRLNFGNSLPSFDRSVKNIDGFARYNRFIVLSEVTSDTIPNILDLLFNITSGSIDMIPSDAEKTRVIVINNSEVYGSYKGKRDTRTRSVYIHHGMADCKIDRINGDTPIRFTDVDYNVIADKPSEVMSGPTWKSLGEVKLSYDSDMFGNILYRDTDSYQSILTPSPEFYDEKDMVLLSGREEDYYTQVLDNKESVYFNDKDSYMKNLYTLTLNQLIDDHTKVMKLNIKIDNLSNNRRILSTETVEDLNMAVQDICSQIKYDMEKNGFSSGEIILNGRNGYNVTGLKTYLDLNAYEKRINFENLCYLLDELNAYTFGDELYDYSLMIKVDYSNIKVVIVDFVPSLIGGEINTTDRDVKEISEQLKTESSDFSTSIGWGAQGGAYKQTRMSA